MSRTTALGALSALACAIPVAAGPPALEVIYTEIPGDPTSVVPGAVDLTGTPVATQFRAIEVLSVSPDGSEWLLKARNELGSDLETMMLRGSGTAGTTLAQEGQPVAGGLVGEVYDFFGSSPASFNEVGQFVFTARARGGIPALKQKGMFFDGGSLSIVRAESDLASGLSDAFPNPSGDELFGNSFGSMHVLNDGTFGYQDGSLTNIASSRRPAIFYDDTSFQQSGVTPIGPSLWDSIDSNDFWTTPDGSRWIAQGDDEQATSIDDILVVDGTVVLREGSPVGAGITMSAVFATKLLSNGDWFSRGDDPNDDDWAVRSGTVLAATGDAIGADTWGAVFLAFTGNRVGDWVLAGRTMGPDATNDILALNGTTVLVREGDPVDVDGNGVFDDDAFIGRGNSALSAFNPDDLFLTDDGVVYFLAPLRNGAGADLALTGAGDAFLRLTITDCPEDLNGNGDVDFADILAVIAAWGPCIGCDEDLTNDNDVGFADILAVIAAWGPCP